MKVLLATDGSSQSTTALRTASRMLRREKAEFDLLCVTPELYYPKGSAGKDAKKRARMIEAYRDQIQVEARERLIQAQAMLGPLGVDAGMRVEIGSPARVITRVAAEYDVTVVGAHDQYTQQARVGAGREPRRRSSARGSVGRERVERDEQTMADTGGS